VAFQVIPRERGFYDLLEQAAEGVAVGAKALQELVGDFPDAEEHAHRIRDLEHAGDDLTHRLIALLNTTFVTPLDRHDIHHLASSLDDVLDEQEEVADLLVLYKIEEPIPHLRLQVDVLVGATEAVVRAVRALRSPREADRAWVDIIRLERDGDHVYRRIVAELYSGDYRAMDVLKWKDIVEAIEHAIDRCEDIANTIESIVLKHA
jgi:predicted phosphate transport protein (TIGR00153 family)